MEIFQNDNHFDHTHNEVVGLQLKMCSKKTKKDTLFKYSSNEVFRSSKE